MTKVDGQRLPRVSILHRVNPHFGALAAASRNRQIKAVEALPLLPVIPGRSRADGGRNLGQKLVVVGIGHLKRVDKTLSTRHVNALAVGVEVQIVSVLDARERGDEAA